MSVKNYLLMLCLCLHSVAGHADEGAVERLFWDKVPLRITLPVNQERLVTFPVSVRVGIPGTLSAKLRTQSHQGTVYWLAHEAFDSQRIEVRTINGNAIYLIDLKAAPSGSAMPIEVIDKHQDHPSKKPSTQPSHGVAKRAPGYVALTRFAAQQLYAPARLLKPTSSIHRVSVARQPLTHLIHGETIVATPVASWQSGALYVTAVELHNIGPDPITLDPRKIRGAWRTATFQHARLHPTGSESDTTAVYLISDRPFHEVI